MNDRPSTGELIDAVKLFLEKELLPSLSDPRLKFQTLIAVHALTMTQRERVGEEERLRAEWVLLGGKGEVSDSVAEVRRLEIGLCEAISRGDYDGSEETLRPILRAITANKLAVANPAYLGQGSSPKA